MMTTRPVAITAQFTAKAREIESQRSNALFHDPWAHLFSGLAGEKWLEWLAHQQVESPGHAIILRTRYFDDFLQQYSNEQSIEQIVLLAAGYDTRAYRLEWPAKTILFEIDQPAVLSHKAEILNTVHATPRCDRRAIGVDLASNWSEPLLKAGFRQEIPSLWLLEGLLMYLPQQDATQLIMTITKLAHEGSGIGFDLLNQAMLTSAATQKRVQRLEQSGMPWQFGVDDPRAWLEPFGWISDIKTAEDAGQQYQRQLRPLSSHPLPTSAKPSTFFITARRLPS
jgi:methyltransferase (TIGR00027 family)